MFGYWLEQNHYGKYVQWEVSEGVQGMERCVIAVERDGSLSPLSAYCSSASVASSSSACKPIIVVAVDSSSTDSKVRIARIGRESTLFDSCALKKLITRAFVDDDELVADIAAF